MKNSKLFCILVCVCVFSLQSYANGPLDKQPNQLHEEIAVPQPDYSLLELAVQATLAQDYEQAIEYYQAAELSNDAWVSWAGISGQVAVYRMINQPEKATEVTRDVAQERPELAGLMLIWEADTLGLNENVEQALATYQRAVDEYGSDNVDGKPLGAAALKQLSFSYLNLGQPLEAAQSLRKQLLEFPTSDDPDLTVARVLTYEALANSPSFPIHSLGTLAEEGICTSTKPCIVQNNKIATSTTVPKGSIRLGGMDGLYYKLSDAQREFLSEAREKSATEGGSYAGPTMYATSCTPSAATDGFQDPYNTSSTVSGSFSGYGDIFMSYPAAAGGYHPGVDFNTANDCGDSDGSPATPSGDFEATAQGCVTESVAIYPTRNTSTWGTMTVKHYYYPAQSSSYYWTSQYGHGDYSYYSVYSAVTKGTNLGEMDGMPLEADGSREYSCHLHFEIREYDHTSRSDADYWSTSSQTTVGDYYQDPETFIDTHTRYSSIFYGDENNFSTTYCTAAWSSSTTVGDEGSTSTTSTDMKYVTRASSKTACARTFFTPTSSGTYYLYVFTPWNYATSTSVPIKLVQNSSGTVKINGTFNQLYSAGGTAGYGCGETFLTPSWVTYTGEKCDEWGYVGSSSLTSGTQYYVEFANNTGESSSTIVGLDDILIIKQ